MTWTSQTSGPGRVEHSSRSRRPDSTGRDDVGRQAIGLRHAADIRQRLAGAAIAADARLAEEGGLRRANRGVAVVVQHEERDRELQACDGFEFLDVELEPAVAVDADGTAPAAGEACADGGRNAEAHRAEGGGVKDPLPVLDAQRQQEELDAAAGTARHDVVVWPQLVGQDVGEVIDADGPSGARCSGSTRGYLAFQAAHCSRHCQAVASGRISERRASSARMKAPASAQIFVLHRAAELRQLRRVDVDHHLVRVPGEVFGIEAGDDAVETRADREQEIAVLNGEVRAARRDGAGPADEQRMVIADQIDREPCRLERNVRAPRPARGTPSPRAPVGCRCRRAAADARSG